MIFWWYGIEWLCDSHKSQLYLERSTCQVARDHEIWWVRWQETIFCHDPGRSQYGIWSVFDNVCLQWMGVPNWCWHPAKVQETKRLPQCFQTSGKKGLRWLHTLGMTLWHHVKPRRPIIWQGRIGLRGRNHSCKGVQEFKKSAWGRIFW